MNNFNIYIFILLLASVSDFSYGQQAVSRSLQPGDSIPQEVWALSLDVISHPDDKNVITLSEYKEKLIILDFWATWCGPCITMLPKQDSLQQQFKDQLQILPVTYQKAEEVISFMENYEKHRGIRINLPKVINNQSLKPYFQHGTIPHYIWIKDGKVQAITGMDEIKEEHVAAILKGEKTAMKTKSQVPRMGYEGRNGSLLEFLAHKKPELIRDFSYRSGLSGYIEGLSSSMTIAKPKEGIPYWRITFTNVPLLRLYQFGFGEGATFTNSATLKIESRDSLLIMSPHGMTDFSEWNGRNTYCYEFMVPESRSEEAFQLFRNELKMLFPQYKVVIEDREVPVLALERNGAALKTSSAEKLTNSYDGFTYVYSGGAPSLFVRALNGQYLYHIGKPIVDMTGVDEHIELTLEVNMSDVESLNAALKDHGLRLVEKEAVVQVLVIKDADSAAGET